MNKRKIIFIILISILCFNINLLSQNLLTHNYTIENGLPSNIINAVCQDSSGFIWIATSEGLSKFDSKEFKNYTIENGLPTNNIYCVLTDKRIGNKIWIGTIGKGVVQYNRGHFISFDKNLAPKEKVIDCFYMDTNDRLWCGTDSSLYYIKNDSLIRLKNTLNIGAVNSITENNKGNILIGADNGFFTYIPDKNKFTKMNLSLRNHDEISSIKCTKNNSILILTVEGWLFRIKNKKINSLLLNRIGSFYNICKSSSPYIYWVTSDHGLYKVNIKNLKKITFLNKKNGLSGDNIKCVFYDKEGVLWLGTNGKGIYKIPYTNLLKFNIPESVKNVYNVETVIDSNHHTWIIKSDRLIELWQDNNSLWHMFTHIKLTINSPGALAKIYLYKGKRLIVTYNRGLIKEFNIINKYPHSSQPSKLVQSSYANLTGKYTYYEIFLATEDRAGYLWLSAIDMGVVVLNKANPRKVIKIYTDKTGLPDNSIRCIYQDKQGNYWFGGYNKGLTFYSLDKVKKDLGLKYNKSKVSIKKYRSANGLPNNSVRSVIEDNSGKIYIGTRYGGLAILNNEKFKNINKADGILSNGIWDVKVIPQSGIWLATQSGIQKINFNETTSDELMGILPKIPFFSISFDENEIIFANPTEVFVYEYRKNNLKNIIHPIIIKELLVNGKQHPVQKSIKLSNTQNNISFRFISITNKVEERKYEYRLLNKEKKWNKLINRNSVAYSSLAPGKYLFQVAALNSLSGKISDPVEVSFIIDAPFYTKLWFDLLIIFIVVVIAVSFLRYRIKRLIEIERVREKIAAELHDEIGSGLTKIAILSEHASIQNNSEGKDLSYSNVQNPAVEKVGSIARNLVDQMNDVIWSINPKYDKLEDFIIHFKNYAYEVCEAKDIELKIETSNIKNIKLDSNTKRKLQLISTEALNNSLKHSGCKKINYSLYVKNKIIYLEFKDDGMGFKYNGDENGNGLFNMKKHISELNGSIKINSEKTNGTTIKISIPNKSKLFN